jgi:hypothetical protein
MLCFSNLLKHNANAINAMPTPYALAALPLLCSALPEGLGNKHKLGLGRLDYSNCLPTAAPPLPPPEGKVGIGEARRKHNEGKQQSNR